MPERLNRKLIKKHFGKNADIRSRWFASGFRVKTDSGGEVLVSQKKCKIITGGDDIYRAVVLISKDLRGRVTAYGDHEQLMAFVAHGEVCNVPVRIGGKSAWLFHDRKRMAADVAFTFPRINGGARFSTDEDLEKGGLL